MTVLNTRHGEIDISNTYYGEKISMGAAQVDFDSPPAMGDSVRPVTAVLRSPRLTGAGFGDCRKLIQFAEDLCWFIDTANEPLLEDTARAVAEAAKVKEAEDAAAREVVVAERTEILLNELVGEKVKVRHRNYKSMCYAFVRIDERPGVEDGEIIYTPRLRWTDQGHGRGSQVDRWARLDVKTPDGWRTVWDDGTDDLPSYDRAAKLPKVVMYR